ncbi:MAG: hypothetical protein IJT13_03410 [Bacteroidaceae bacterium]|nr:hypothetical protein [Bacteroidaceae bacterium]
MIKFSLRVENLFSSRGEFIWRTENRLKALINKGFLTFINEYVRIG